MGGGRWDKEKENEEYSLVIKGKEAAAFSPPLEKLSLKTEGDLSPCSNLGNKNGSLQGLDKSNL